MKANNLQLKTNNIFLIHKVNLILSDNEESSVLFVSNIFKMIYFQKLLYIELF